MTAPDPYRTPEADLDGTAGLRPRPVRGVLIGLVVDWGGTIVLSLVFAVVYAGMLAARGLSESEILAVFESIEPTSPFGLASMAMGTGMSLLGGWVCVRVGRSPSLRPPAVLAGLAVLIGLGLSGNDVDLGMNLMMMLFSVSATMIGAWLAIQRYIRTPAVGGRR